MTRGEAGPAPGARRASWPETRPVKSSWSLALRAKPGREPGQAGNDVPPAPRASASHTADSRNALCPHAVVKVDGGYRALLWLGYRVLRLEASLVSDRIEAAAADTVVL